LLLAQLLSVQIFLLLKNRIKVIIKKNIDSERAFGIIYLNYPQPIKIQNQWSSSSSSTVNKPFLLRRHVQCCVKRGQLKHSYEMISLTRNNKLH
jgi:hypothetical protein